MQDILSGIIVLAIVICAYFSPLFGLLAVIFCITNLFGLVNPDAIVKSGQYNIIDVAIAVTIIIFIKLVIVQKGYRDLRVRKLFTPNIAAFFMIIVVGIFVPYLLYGQPLIMGLRAARRFLLVLLYFPMAVFFMEEKNRALFVKSIRLMALFLAGLYIVQFLLIKKIVFLYLPLSQRYGGVRIHIYGMGLIVAGFIIILNDFLHKRYKNPEVFYLDKMRLLILGSLLLFVIVFISKARVSLFGIGMVMPVTLFASRKIGALEKVIIGSLIVVIISALILANVFDPLVLLFDNELLAQKSNITVRVAALNYYWEQYQRTPLFGMGIQNALYPYNPLSMGFVEGYFLVDIGIVGFTCSFGIAGLVWLMLILKKAFVKLKRVLDPTYHYIILGSITYFLAIFPTVNSFTDNTYMTYFILIIALLAGAVLQNSRDEAKGLPDGETGRG